MRLFDVDWEEVLRAMAVWDDLPTDARALVLTTLKLHGYAPKAQLEPHYDLIAASGLTIANPTGTLVSVREQRRPFVKVLRAMHRHPVFDEPSIQQLTHYLEQHFTMAEMMMAGGAPTTGGLLPTRHALAMRIASSHWLDALMEAGSKKARTSWMSARGLDATRLFGSDGELVTHLQALVQELRALPEGIPLRELVLKTDRRKLPALAMAIHGGLATLVLFAGMRKGDLEPMIGLWPGVVAELSRPPAAAPVPVRPAEEFAFPVAMEDMTTVLAHVSGSPARLRSNDLLIFARARAEIEQRLVAVPPWALEYFSNAQSSRVDHAARSLSASGFVVVRDRHSNPHLESTDVGVQWLALSARDRLASLLNPIRNATDVNPGSSYDYSSEARFFPFTFPWRRPAKSLRLRDALTRAFLTASRDFIPLEEFLVYLEREKNPLLEAVSTYSPDPHGFGAHAGDPRDVSRTFWRNALTQFLFMRLLPVGGASLGRTSDGSLCFKLTSIGRYLLGDAATFEYGSGPAGDVIVQPNFDVVFLGAAPSAEAIIARFGERAGMAPGLVFRITKASVLAAAESGMAVADVIGALAQASSKRVPKNVEREIAGWMATVRRVSLRHVQLIECADEESAQRVASVLGAKVRRIAPMVFELPAMNSATRATVTKKLRAAGVFLDLVPPAVAAKGRKRARLDDEWDDFG